MSLERKLQAKYGRDSYQRTFSKDFREAIKGMDSIYKIISKATQNSKDSSKEQA